MLCTGEYTDAATTKTAVFTVYLLLLHSHLHRYLARWFAQHGQAHAMIGKRHDQLV